MDPASVRKENERRYFDENWSKGTRRSAKKFYSITESSKKFYAERLFDDCAGKRFLELGCGPGSYAFELARHNAEVVGIDLSSKAIEIAEMTAAEQGVSGKAKFHVGDAENTGYPDASFDVVCGTGILHHLDMEAAMREAVRLLTSKGRGIFYEPLRHNILINLYRKATPHLRSPDERALTSREIDVARAHFECVELRFFHLLGLMAIPFRRTAMFSPMTRALDSMDAALFRAVPGLRLQAWVVVLELSKPRRAGRSS